MWTYSQNVVTASTQNGGAAFYQWKECLKAAGWTVVASGDGLAAFSVGTDVITNNGTGANGADNDNAWICLQQPAGGAAPYSGTRQWSMQLGAAGGVGNRFQNRLVYSEGGTANTGASSATQSPTFTDENTINGSGTPAAPGFAQWVGGGASPGTFNVVAGGAAENFSFAFWALVAAAASPNGWWGFDGVTDLTSGETSPFVPFFSISPMNSGSLVLFPGGPFVAIFGGAAPPWVNTSVANGQSFNGGTSGQLRENPFTGDVPLLPLFYGRPNTAAAPGGAKGKSTLMAWTAAGKTIRDTLTVSTPLDRIVMQDLVFPWDGTVPA